MPTYCYTVPDTGITEERYFDMGKAPASIMTAEGLPAHRDIVAEQTGGVRATGWATGLKSQALAVHPDQIKEARDYSRKHGVPTEFSGDGCPIFTGRAHRKRYCRAWGAHDNDGGYGDA